jgi:DNA-binding NtrC family response regulator
VAEEDRSRVDAARGRTRLLDVGGRPKLALPRATLAVEAGPSTGQRASLGGSTLRIGSGSSCDLVLEDASVSSTHCELRPTELGVRLRDLGSTNGSFVDGRRVVDVYLGDAALLAVGESTIRFTIEPGEEVVDLSRATNFGGLLGHSPGMRAAFALLEGAAKTDATVLILGETGTGKEVAARALHDRSARAGGPFVILDCGATSPALLEAQLFGHARGAFTGAAEAREGLFEAADGGTLVLDEIGELPLDLQPKLLRALEARTICRLGETRPRSFDARFVASTHRNLAAEVKAGRFRQDLFYRLSVVTVHLPPLVERKEEVPRLLASFLARLSKGSPPDIPPPLLAVLASHDWPGNVRELRNFAERFLALPGLPAHALLGPTRPASAAPAAATAPTAPAASLEVDLSQPFHDAKRDQNERFERAYFEALLARYGDNISEAARVAGLSRQTCYRLMQKYGLRGLD